MRLKRSFISYGCALALLAGSVIASAQEKQQETSDQPANTFYFQVPQGAPPVNYPGPAFPGGGRVFLNGIGMQAPDRMNQFASAEMGFDNRVVLNAPVAGVIVCENIQTLSDGNRIINRSTTTIYRDGLGRTRREQVFNLPGQPAGGANERRMIYINDVVGGTSYSVDPDKRTAIKNMLGSFRTAEGGRAAVSSLAMPVPPLSPSSKLMRVSGGGLESNATRRVAPSYPIAAREAKVQGAVQVNVSVNENGEVVSAEAVSGPDLLREAALEAAKQWQFKPTTVGGNAVPVQGLLTFNFKLQGGNEGATNLAPQAAPPLSLIDVGGSRVKVENRIESLGTQMVEGVAAEGTRQIQTIPAGAIGNERQIDIVSERWYSPELQMVILIKHSDPRYGETTQRLTNIDRNEPETSLFSVDGYEIKEGFGPKLLEQKLEEIRKMRQKEQQ
jgi:TonB family protein